MKPLHPQHGTSLVEILTALLLCALTGMAVAKGLVLSLHQTMDHKLEVLAQTVANDFVERTYANRSAALAGLYATHSTADTSTRACEGRTCTPSELATYDLGHWSKMRQRILPGSEALATIQNHHYTLTLIWFTRIPGPQATTCALSTQAGQRCLQLEWDV
jgi:type IV pilus modification protein PilV